MKSKLIPIVIAVLVILLVVGGIYYVMRDGDGLNLTGGGDAVSAQEAIEQFDPQEDIDASFARLDYYILQPPKHDEAAAEAVNYIQDSDETTRFVAVYFLGNTGNSTYADQLLPALEDDNDAIATIAAATLLGWGKKEAIPILIESIIIEDTIPYSEPPMAIGSLALRSLPLYTEQDFGDDAVTSDEELNNVQAEWKMWWSSNNSNLTWNSETKSYE